MTEFIGDIMVVNTLVLIIFIGVFKGAATHVPNAEQYASYCIYAFAFSLTTGDIFRVKITLDD